MCPGIEDLSVLFKNSVAPSNMPFLPLGVQPVLAPGIKVEMTSSPALEGADLAERLWADSAAAR